MTPKILSNLRKIVLFLLVGLFWSVLTAWVATAMPDTYGWSPTAKGFLAGMPAGLGAFLLLLVAWALVKEEQGRRDRERATFRRMTG